MRYIPTEQQLNRINELYHDCLMSDELSELYVRRGATDLALMAYDAARNVLYDPDSDDVILSGELICNYTVSHIAKVLFTQTIDDIARFLTFYAKAVIVQYDTGDFSFIAKVQRYLYELANEVGIVYDPAEEQREPTEEEKVFIEEFDRALHEQYELNDRARAQAMEDERNNILRELLKRLGLDNLEELDEEDDGVAVGDVTPEKFSDLPQNETPKVITQNLHGDTYSVLPRDTVQGLDVE